MQRLSGERYPNTAGVKWMRHHVSCPSLSLPVPPAVVTGAALQQQRVAVTDHRVAVGTAGSRHQCV